MVVRDLIQKRWAKVGLHAWIHAWSSSQNFSQLLMMQEVSFCVTGLALIVCLIYFGKKA
jgi:hypothetical protein